MEMIRENISLSKEWAVTVVMPNLGILGAEPQCTLLGM